MAIEVKRQEARDRFLVELDDGKEAYLEYRDRGDGTLEYAHTFVPESHRRREIGEDLVVEALNYARDQGLVVIPSCPFVRHVVEDRHPEYASLIADGAGDGDDGAAGGGS